MSVSRIMQQAAAGAAGGGATYVDDVFSTYLYDGTGSAQTITNGIDLAGEGGLVWIKDRSVSGQYNSLYDTERGANEVLISDQTWTASSANGGVSAFNDDGFSINTYDDVNRNNSDLVSWTFRKQPGFFDVVTYTGTGSVRTVSHNLGSVPGMIIIKRTSSSGSNWRVYHTSLGNGQALSLNTTDAAGATTSLWNSTTPTDSVFTLGDNGNVNQLGQDFVAYLFAHDAQDFGTDSDEAIIKCGSYTGNGSNDGPTIDLGFEPQWLMIKDTTTSGYPWQIIDSMRGIISGGSDSFLKPNASDAESAYDIGSLTATGFKITNNSSWSNTSGNNYIYMAIRRPHKPASKLTATDLFAIASQTNNIPSFNAGFVVDMAFQKDINNTYSAQPILTSRLIQGKYLTTSSTSAETSISNRDYDYNTGYSSGLGNNSTSLSWMFRRSPGFFDVVTYEGIGGPQNINHNLGVAPELIIVKDRDAAVRWAVWYNGIGTDANGYNKYLVLNQTDGDITGGSVWLDMVPTASVFRPYDAFVSEANRSYIAYLFATTPGISKVGTYTGTGSNVDVDCGFSSGARFVLAKRTDSTGDWYVWDSERGIVAGNDPYLFLNTTAAQVTSTDYIDPLSSGFTITSSAPAALNASGGTYLFLAIA